ncbi:MAG: DUF1211 domain-containing protein [Deltaproteobacteria bacterium]|nr:DUF1211 domain-containing protein [Deltaproteobacteria bacterium]
MVNKPESEGQAETTREAKEAIHLTPARLETLTDGIFAIAMTILILNITVPHLPPEEFTESQLFHELYSQGHALINYAVSFTLLGVFWLIHHQQFHFIVRTNIWHIWMNLIGLLLVGLVPFTTSLIGEHRTSFGAVALFEANMLLIGLVFYAQWAYATGGRRLTSPDLSQKEVLVGKRMNLILPATSCAAAGLAILNPYSHQLGYLSIPVIFGLFHRRLLIFH